MNKIETIIYNAVRKNPALKQSIRNIYQNIYDMLPRKSEFFSKEYDFKEGYFFGFHDISPLSADETKLLVMRNKFDLRMPLPNEEAEVGYLIFKDGKLGDWKKLSDTFAWNYHKGARLQWLNSNSVIFNTAINNALVAKIIDISSLKERVINYPIDSIYHNNGISLATSFSYERLERCMPGYGYPYCDNGKINESAPKDTGLFLVNLDTGNRSLLLSLERIALEITGKIEKEYLHFVTHTEFSLDGRYISFLYRRIPKEGDYMKRRTVMAVYDLKEERLIVLPSQESGSHYVWNMYNQIIASCNIDGKNCHALFDMNNPNEVTPIASDKLNSDGHQSFIDNSTFITDTYPDKYRLARLYKADIRTGDTTLLASVYSPKQFQTKDFHCHIACDLHPRVIGKGKYVCFDSPRTGVRGIYIMKL